MNYLDEGPLPNRVRAAAILALLLCSAPVPTRAASALSDATVSPTAGTTATPFTLTVRYTSTDRPTRPAQSVWAQVGGARIALVKVAGTAHDGTWQATTTLPAGTWPVTFHAAASGEPAPDPISGPTVTVTPAPAAPQPTIAPQPVPTEPPAPPPPGGEVAQPTRAATDGPAGVPASSGGGSRTLHGTDSKAATPRTTPAVTLGAEPDGYVVPPTTGPGTGVTTARQGIPLQVPLILVGVSMSLAGAALLARRWVASRTVPTRHPR